MSAAAIKESILHDITHWGVRAAVGVTFIVHSIGKFSPGFAENLPNMGLPSELQLPIALAELVGGIMLVAGALTRISAAVLSIVMLGAIFHIKWENGFLVRDGGWEWDLILLAAMLMVIVTGPGRASISHLVKKIPRFLQ